MLLKLIDFDVFPADLASPGSRATLVLVLGDGCKGIGILTVFALNWSLQTTIPMPFYFCNYDVD